MFSCCNFSHLHTEKSAVMIARRLKPLFRAFPCMWSMVKSSRAADNQSFCRFKAKSLKADAEFTSQSRFTPMWKHEDAAPCRHIRKAEADSDSRRWLDAVWRAARFYFQFFWWSGCLCFTSSAFWVQNKSCCRSFSAASLQLLRSFSAASPQLLRSFSAASLQLLCSFSAAAALQLTGTLLYSINVWRALKTNHPTAFNNRADKLIYWWSEIESADEALTL